MSEGRGRPRDVHNSRRYSGGDQRNWQSPNDNEGRGLFRRDWHTQSGRTE